MDVKTFNSSEFDKEKAIREDYTNIKYDETYDENLYELAIQEYLKSDKFESLNESQQEEVKKFFEQIKIDIDVPQQEGKFKLPKQFYLNIIKNALSELSFIKEYDPKYTQSFEKRMESCKGKLRIVEQSDNKFDYDTASLLWEIYNREDLSIGIHGTELSEDFDISEENCDFFKHGIMVNSRYENGDARRTVNFQDLPGKQWAFGNISFLKLLNYQYRSMNSRSGPEGPTASYNCIVVRPSSMKDTSYHEDCPQEYSIVTGPTSIVTNSGRYLSGHLIKPEFILGVFKNNQQFVRNPKCDLEKLSELNSLIEQRNREVEEQKKKEQESMTEKLTKETSGVTAPEKRGMFSRIASIFRGKERENSERGM